MAYLTTALTKEQKRRVGDLMAELDKIPIAFLAQVLTATTGFVAGMVAQASLSPECKDAEEE